MIQNPKFLNKICTTCVLLKKIQTIVTCQKQRQQQMKKMKYKHFTWIQKNLKLIAEWGNVWTRPNVETLGKLI